MPGHVALILDLPLCSLELPRVSAHGRRENPVLQFGSKQTSSLLLMTGCEDGALSSLPPASSLTSNDGKEGTTKGFKLVAEARKFDDGSGSDSESSSGASAKSGSSLLSRRSQSSMYKSGLSISAKDKLGDSRSYRELLESKGYKITGRTRRHVTKLCCKQVAFIWFTLNQRCHRPRPEQRLPSPFRRPRRPGIRS